MERQQNAVMLVVGALVAAAGVLVTPTAAAAAAELTRVSSDPYTNPTSQHRTQVEPDSFSFGRTVVSAFQSGRFRDGGASNVGWSTSRDAGSSWTDGFLPGTTTQATPPGPYDRVTDPSVAYDAKHHTWLISTVALTNTADGPLGAAVVTNRSTDGARTFSTPTIVRQATGTEDLDKNWTVCDNTPSSRFYGHCYTEWDDVGHVNLFQMSTSTDGGQTWQAPTTSPDNPCVIGGQPVVQPNGTVIVPISDCFEGSLLSIRSTDGGKSWSRVRFAAQTLSSLVAGNLRTGPLVSAEIDRNGKVYAVWQDCRFEAPNCAVNDIVMTTSSDGITWSPVTRIPADPIGSGVDHFIPGLAVDKTTGGSHVRLALTYYYYPDATCTPETCKLDVGFVSSTNSGKSWSAKQQLAGPMNVSWLADTTQGFMVGDYISTSIAGAGNDATPVFALAQAPTGTLFREAIFASSGSIAKITGGSLQPDTDTGVAVSPKAAAQAGQPLLSR